MGEFGAGRWLIGTSVYLFFLFLLLTSATNASIITGLDNPIEVNNHPNYAGLNPQEIQTYCSGNPRTFCSIMAIQTNDSCSEIVGCSYDAGLNQCIGKHNITDCRGLNESQCQILGCTWIGQVTQSDFGSDDRYSIGYIGEVFSFFEGYHARVIFPPPIDIIFNFLFLWLPSIILLYALYMTLPFIH